MNHRLRNRLRQNINKISKFKNWTQTTFSQYFSVSRKTMNSWLNDDSSPKKPEQRAKWAELLRKPESELFFYGPDSN